MAPQSNQTSISSGVRRMVPPHEQENVTASTDGLWRSSGSRTFSPSRSSATLPTHFSFLHESQIQTGRGVPQNRSRDSAQSLFSSSQLPKRPAPTSGGTQLIC